MITQVEVKHLFVYERRGMLRRRALIGRQKVWYPWRGIGKDTRYLAADIHGKTYYLHRLIWLYHNGDSPRYIDHRDLDASNNRIENLRPCTPSQNQYNSPRKLNNKSGHKGVVHHRRCKSRPWQAKIVVNKKVVSLGYYGSAAEAGSAYQRGAVKYAGEFARA